MNLKDQMNKIAGLWSLAKGLSITGRTLFDPVVTVHYPRREVDNLESFRGPLILVPKPGQPGSPRCIACLMCMNTCPSGCITVTRMKAPEQTPQEKEEMAAAEARGEKVKKPAAPKAPGRFIYDYSLCSLCGLCVEVCPAGAIAFSSQAYMVTRGRQELKMDLLERLSRRTN